MPRAILVLLIGAALCACSSDPYPFPTSGFDGSNPASVNAPVTTTVVWLQVRPGDRIELLSAEAVGLAPEVSVRFMLSRPVHEANGDDVIGESFEPLEGLVVSAASASSGPANTVGIEAELTAHESGRYDLTTIRLHLRLNGGEERVSAPINLRWTICAADPAPVSCDASPSP